MSSLFRRLVPIVASAATLLSLSSAATVTHNFRIGWVTSNPDGAFDRPTIGINDQWPIPPIVADIGDNIVINVLNLLGNQSTSLHFHGLFMNGTTHMDGPSQVSQCSIAPGSSFTYNFTVKIRNKRCISVMELTNMMNRLTNLAHIGTILIPMDNIPMG